MRDLSDSDLAGIIYKECRKAFEGRAANGSPLLDWIDIYNDPKRKKKSNAWINVAITARKLMLV